METNLEVRFFLERRDVIVWRLKNGVATVLYMVLDFQIMVTRNRGECFVCDGLRGRRHDMSLYVCCIFRVKRKYVLMFFCQNHNKDFLTR